MKNFKKLLKLQAKRNSLWIILLIIATLLINTISFTYKIKETNNNLEESVQKFEYLLDLKENEISKKPNKINDEYLEYANNLRAKLIKKYKIITNDELSKLESKKVDEYYGKDRKEVFYEASNAISNYDYNIKLVKSKKAEDLIFAKNANAFMFFVVLIMAIILTSIEHMSNYFDFTRMLPWSKSKDFLMKTVMGILLTTLIFIVQIGIEHLIIMTSSLSEIYSLGGNVVFFLKELILLLLLFIIFVSAGVMSGNIFGHLGINVVIFGFFNIIFYSLSVIESIIKGVHSDQLIINKFNDFVSKQNPIIRHFIFPLKDTDYSNEFIIGYAMIALIVFLIGILVAKNMKTEKAGYMIMNKIIEKVCFIFAVFSLNSVIFTLLSSTIYNINMYLGLVLYFFLLFTSYKLFKAFFNVKLKV